MPDFTIALPEEIVAELGARARTRRLMLNVSTAEMAERIGISDRTLRNFELTGHCTLETFVRVLEALNATADLASVLVTQTRSIEDMRAKAQVKGRQRATKKTDSAA